MATFWNRVVRRNRERTRGSNVVVDECAEGLRGLRVPLESSDAFADRYYAFCQVLAIRCWMAKTAAKVVSAMPLAMPATSAMRPRLLMVTPSS